ncbi:hypothetical protein GYN24_08445 [Lactococcus piscium]|uniref:TIR domain-containing protein n=1 Tax=Pseudolactococcus paracarnosus TaxID=2749962 RepID=A0A7L4WFQ7_9LACT|nr:toll/interleukin-1 receptor domain-containing protein [Lactococcus paracarnosus]MCJ1994607.1 hypothetical protein [Lactococcus paracarnosus]QDJ28303.1 hypothetical protein BHS01_07095 [Lactococcus paracarnosus]SPC35290.1 conserved hypothetical protein [Lactococcus piscium]
MDTFENRPGTKLNEYMANGISSSRFILCICAETYLEKIDMSNTGVNNEIKLLEEMSDKPYIMPIIEKDNLQVFTSFFEGKFRNELLFDRSYSQYNVS